jgi:hypothetical protein
MADPRKMPRQGPWTKISIILFYICVFRMIQAARPEDVLYQATFEQLLQAGALDLHSEDEPSDQLPLTRQSEMEEKHHKISPEPWSYTPVCTDHDIHRINERLCVYVNTSAGNGQGISLFTTPRLSTAFAELLASIEAKGVSSEYDDATNSQPWYTAPIPGKGIGLLAKHDLVRGDLITSSKPVLLAYKENILSKVEREKFLHLAISQLPPPSREAYLSLATMYHDPAVLTQDIASANSFEIVVAGTPHLAVLLEPSRINHDCAPNAVFHVNSTSLTHTVRATRPIQKNEEITIAYTNPLDSQAKRQAYLSSSFGFKCSCSRCQRSDVDDAILTAIVSLQQSLSHWSDPTSSASVKQAEELIQLHQDAGLEGYLDPAYCIAALMYSSVGSERGAMRYLKLCIEAIELRLGPGAENLPQWREMLQNPRRHWSWLRRKRG